MTGGRKRRLPASGGELARFKTPKADPDATVSLAEDHPAVLEGRPLFPSRVMRPWESERMIVEGKNNPKVGGKIINGDWAGMPAYTLTLPERSSCPASCSNWRSCYGNSMWVARRNDHTHPDFLAALVAEVVTIARLRPNESGFVVRLHVLGDFFSVRYVAAWAQLLDLLPNLHIYGYTSRKLDDPDRKTRNIARALKLITDHHWNRFAIRTSHTEAGRDRTIVVDEAVNDPDVIMCPAQVEKTATCGTCALCWAPGARDKTIAFLRHGIKGRSPRIEHEESLPMNIDHFWTDRRLAIATRLWESQHASASQIADYLGNGCTRNAVIGKMNRMRIEGGPQRGGRPQAIDKTLLELKLPRNCAA